MEAQRQAKKDNDMVYNERVPPIETLAKCERIRMVKPLEPKELSEPELVFEPSAPEPAAPVPPPPLPLGSAANPIDGEVGPWASAISSGLAAIGLGSTPRPPPSAAAPAAEAPSEAPPPAAVAPSPPAEDPPGLSELMAMGFTRAASIEALQQTGGSIEAAADRLLSQS
jgi:hypothetical protein